MKTNGKQYPAEKLNLSCEKKKKNESLKQKKNNQLKNQLFLKKLKFSIQKLLPV
jgi:hypothetical protein